MGDGAHVLPRVQAICSESSLRTLHEPGAPQRPSQHSTASGPLDRAARYGGEEFAVLLYDSPRGYAEAIAQQLHISLTALRMLHPASAVASHVTVSIGIACVEPKFGRCPEGMTQLADETLYAAKEAGRNRTVVMDREYYTLHTGAFRSHKPHGDPAT